MPTKKCHSWTMTVHLLPAFQDNYLFVAEFDGRAMVVDPGEAEPVAQFLQASKLSLELILVTHHHDDHCGGVTALQSRFSQARVFGPSSLAHSGITCDRVLHNADHFQFADHEWKTIAVPGHTLDHLAYFSQTRETRGHQESLAIQDPPVLFCGDSLFSLGCGRVFEGTFSQSFQSLQRLKSLPQNTQVYCAHEYTLRNLDFTIDYIRSGVVHDLNLRDLSVEQYLRLHSEITSKRAGNLPTVPTTIGFELQNNLFLRAQAVEDFTKIRLARNEF